MSSVDDQVATQIANIERSTGRSMGDWAQIVRASGLGRHGQAVAMLKAEYGVGHGNANRIVTEALKKQAGGAPSPDELVESQYSGASASLRPAYEAVVAAVSAFGDDVEFAPKKTYVSMRRRKQFGQVGPAAGQLEVSLNLPGREATERLRPATGMATHRVRISDARGLDDELLGWLREAYAGAGAVTRQ